MYYSWEIKVYNKITGKPNYEGKTLTYKDASDISQSNWTRFVNCNLDDDKNNLTMTQKFDKIYYRTLRKIKKGEELFVNYGEEYILYNIKKNG